LKRRTLTSNLATSKTGPSQVRVRDVKALEPLLGVGEIKFLKNKSIPIRSEKSNT